MRLLKLVLMASLCTLGLNARADILDEAAKAAVTNHFQVVNDFTALQFKARLHQALTTMIDTAAMALVENGQPAKANELRRQWSIVGAPLISPIDKLGDHRPMSDWLANVYRDLDHTLGTKTMQKLHLDDIFVVNYAVPVVIEPSGRWNGAEYGRHFVPLAGVITFWTSYAACVGVIKGLPVKYGYCVKTSEVLKSGMLWAVAPRLSDYVYGKFHNPGSQSAFQMNAEALRQQYAREIAKIQK